MALMQQNTDSVTKKSRKNKQKEFPGVFVPFV
jgi:hypothetical protein